MRFHISRGCVSFINACMLCLSILVYVHLLSHSQTGKPIHICVYECECMFIVYVWLYGKRPQQFFITIQNYGGSFLPKKYEVLGLKVLQLFPHFFVLWRLRGDNEFAVSVSKITHADFTTYIHARVHAVRPPAPPLS